jgi:hypothetical protein
MTRLLESWKCADRGMNRLDSIDTGLRKRVTRTLPCSSRVTFVALRVSEIGPLVDGMI